MMLHAYARDVGSTVIINFYAKLARAAWPAVLYILCICAHMHILADHVTLSIS